jgi:transcriptional regulator with XRE-family HTH domain
MRLVEIQREMGFSLRDMSQILGLKKSTYQGYTTGRRAVPRQVMLEAEIAMERNRDFWRGLPDRVDSRIKDDFPAGIPSAAMEG